MVYICIIHNQWNNGNGWKKASDDVIDIAKRLKKPATISPNCPECQVQEKRRESFLQDSVGCA